MTRASSAGSSWEETRRAMVEAVESGRLTAKQVMEELGVSSSAVGGWVAAERRRRAARSARTEFVRVDVPVRDRVAPLAVIWLRGGRRVRVSEGFAAEELARLVRTLESC